MSLQLDPDYVRLREAFMAGAREATHVLCGVELPFGCKEDVTLFQRASTYAASAMNPVKPKFNMAGPKGKLP